MGICPFTTVANATLNPHTYPKLGGGDMWGIWAYLLHNYSCMSYSFVLLLNCSQASFCLVSLGHVGWLLHALYVSKPVATQFCSRFYLLAILTILKYKFIISTSYDRSVINAHIYDQIYDTSY